VVGDFFSSGLEDGWGLREEGREVSNQRQRLRERKGTAAGDVCCLLFVYGEEEDNAKGTKNVIQKRRWGCCYM
jgi:hypothetical protein